MPLTLTPLAGLPLIGPGDDLATMIAAAIPKNGLNLENGDILVVGQKIVSKAEGRMINLGDVHPGDRASTLAKTTQKDPRLIELVLQESRRILRARAGTLIVEHRLGFVCANAGIDHSNVAGPAKGGDEFVLLLPADPDRSAASLRAQLESASGRRLGVIINDSHGRPWRLGTVGSCIGVSGVPPLVDARGRTDLLGYRLQSTLIGAADELAAGASLVMGQAAEGMPVVHVRGFPYALGEGSFGDMIRPAAQDLFR
jgi:coenzyme F420-0:L-glutamate ligase/coenzyme F420-1:gamma-L-glutamate ligase